MGTIVSGSLISKAQTLLQDTAGTRWTSTELLGWLNDGQRDIVMLKPDANTKSDKHQLAVGTKQTLPTTGLIFVDIVRNVTSAGIATGTTIKPIARDQLDAQLPAWHSEAAATNVKYFMYDSRNPKEFYIYPPSAGSNYVELVYAYLPADIAAITAVINLDDIYANALVDYMLHKAYSKDAEFAGNSQRAEAAYTTFRQNLGLTTMTKASTEAVN
jgi:hypothetical protein